MKKIIIAEKIFETFPETHIGIITIKGFDNSLITESEALLRESEDFVRENFSNTPILELPEIQNWRTTYKLLGVKKGTRVSIESLIKRVIKGNEIPSINPLVDLYNSISLKHVFPCGGEDLDKTKGDIMLTFAEGNEEFRQIGSDLNEPPEMNEVVYKDDFGCLCRRWNWREADRTKLTEETNNAVLVIESLDHNRLADLELALEDLSSLCKHQLKAEVKTQIMNKANPVISI